MKSLFIGPYSYGSTSIMRVNSIIQLLNLNDYKVIDFEDPFFKTTRVFRSLGSRMKVGPLINNINKFIVNQLDGDFSYDLVWIDKGVFLKPSLIQKLRKCSKLLIHYTPDPAFTYHQSKLFYKAVEFYDYCVTTKSFEIVSFKKAGAKNVIYCTQGFDKKIHIPKHTIKSKNKSVSFVGHFETYRGEIVQALIDSGIDVHIAGIKWERFVNRNKKNKNLVYYGRGIYGEEYADFISSSKLSLGLVSKWIPELHTTRTMEIPACGTVLVTESNIETDELFLNDEVIFFSDISEIPSLIKNILKDEISLMRIQQKGTERALSSGYDYENIVAQILSKIGLL